jgi:hypothetical protein
MNAIKATVRGGRIELDQPLDLPDGTELLIPLPNGSAAANEDAPMSREEIDRVLAAMEQVQPFDMTDDDERAAWEAERLAQKEWEKAHFAEHGEKLRRMWDDPIPRR